MSTKAKLHHSKTVLPSSMQNYHKPPQLSNNYAQNLLNLEIDFELNDDKEPQLIVQLLEMYTEGLEYYESIRSYKYVYFQRKMNSIVKSMYLVDRVNDGNKRQISKGEVEGGVCLNGKKGVNKKALSRSSDNPELQQLMVDKELNKQQSQHEATIKEIAESLQYVEKNYGIGTVSYSNTNSNSHTTSTKKKTIHNPFKRQQRQRQQLWSQILLQEKQKQEQLFRQKQKQQEERKIQKLQAREKHQQMNESILGSAGQMVSGQQIKKLITKHQEKESRFMEKIERNLSEQEREIERKLEDRRKRKGVGSRKGQRGRGGGGSMMSKSLSSIDCFAVIREAQGGEGSNDRSLRVKQNHEQSGFLQQSHDHRLDEQWIQSSKIDQKAQKAAQQTEGSNSPSNNDEEIAREGLIENKDKDFSAIIIDEEEQQHLTNEFDE